MGDKSSDLPSLPNDPSSGATSHNSSNDVETNDTTRILCKKLGEVRTEDAGKSYEYVITINMLSDDVLLEIFDSLRKDHNPKLSPFIPIWVWHRLVQVCQRWRQLVFGSPRRLDLRLLCTNGTPVRENLDCWPPFPIAIHYPDNRHFTPEDEDDLLAVLEHTGRICHIDLHLTGPEYSEVAAVMQRPFPALTHLTLQWAEEKPPAFPSGFLGGSAPSLQCMHLDGMHLPALPALLSSTCDLVSLSLNDIPEEGYMSPDALVTCLAGLPKLQSLYIGSQLTSSNTDQIRPPSAIRALLPSLTSFQFQGDDEYLEDLLARIDSPRLNEVCVTWDVPSHVQAVQLFKFIDRSANPHLSVIRHAYVNFSLPWVTFKMYPHFQGRQKRGLVRGVIHGQVTRTQILRIAQVFSKPSAMLSRVIHLKLDRYKGSLVCPLDDWLHLFRHFSAIRTLHVSQNFAGDVALALEAATEEMVAEVLPVLDLICLDGQPISCVERFLALRQLSDNPVTIIDTAAEFDERVASYVE